MSWEFLTLYRGQLKAKSGWGSFYILTENDEWEFLSYSYELPWHAYTSGRLAGDSQSDISRVKVGYYELKPRADGPRGWRLELQKTGHRTNIQIHRAHKSMYIKGCILPIHFKNFSTSQLTKGDKIIQSKSEDLMKKIKKRYTTLKKNKKGNAVIVITAQLPPLLDTGTKIG